MAVLSPRLEPPNHLRPYVEALERAQGSGIEFVFHAPPQHGKTQTTAHAFVAWCQRYRDQTHVYSTYNQDRSDDVSELVRRVLYDAGLDPTGPRRLISVAGGNQIKFTSIGGSLTGSPITRFGVHVIDDPVKDREEAESGRLRERAWTWLTDVAETRRHPGSSVILMMTRWHADDLAGRAIRKLGWPYICLPAIAESADDPLGRAPGEALWPSLRPLSHLAKYQRNVYTWSALFQGRPRPRGDTLFREPTFYERLPPADQGFRVGYGIDLAYTESTRADFSVCVRLRRYADSLYVVRAVRKQVQATAFTLALRAEYMAEKGPMLWYCSGTEKAAGQFVAERIPQFRYQVITADKYVRATPAAETWNEGKILVPSSKLAADGNLDWVDEFIEVVCGFTGQNDAVDDDVDALAAGHDLLRTTIAPRRPMVGGGAGRRV